MKLISRFICDTCNLPITIEDGIVIWDDRDYPVSLFVVHNWSKCLEGTHETCPLSCSLGGFILSNGLREYLSLRLAEEDFTPMMRRFIEKGLILPMAGFSFNDLLQRPLVQTQADFVMKRTHLKRSIVECVSRFFNDFDEDAYFLNDEELIEAKRQDLAGEGPVYA